MRLVNSLSRLRVTHFVVILALLLMALPMAATPAVAASPNVVISQVYGGGGNSGATYTNDFVELFNRGTEAVDLAGWSVQYASSTGTTWAITPLTGSIPAGGYYLVQEAKGAGGSVALPTPDATGSIAMSGTNGKVALVNSATALTGTCPTGLVDFVGFGSANCSEATATPALSNTTAALRNGNGCTDTDNNAADFTIGAPAPRNSASPLGDCVVPALSIANASVKEGNAGETTDLIFTVSLTKPALTGGVTFDIATADGTATAGSDYTAQSLSGQSIPAGSTTYQFTVAVNGDETFEGNETFSVLVTNVSGADFSNTPGTGTILEDDPNPVCKDPYQPISAIQGSGPAAAITGTVTTQGVVVGDFEGSASASGFYLQDATGDGDPATSDGIFVYTGSADTVKVGEVARVTGYARERFSQTAINGTNGNSAAVPAANIVDCGAGSVTPTDVELPFASATDPERYEGMLVRLPQPLVISEYFNYDRFGEIVLGLPLDGESRPFTGTAVDEPGAPALARAEANSLRRITLDDANSASNPATLRHPNGQPFSLTNYFRGGDTVQNTVGVLGYDFNLYRIFPTGPADYTAVNPRPTAPEPVSGSLKVAVMNTLNYFVTPDYPNKPEYAKVDNKCGPLNTLECRGWDSDQPTEFDRQRDKLLLAIAGSGGDIVGLNELENSTGVEPLADLVSGLGSEYAFINTGVIGTDAIKVGMLYKPAVVTPVGDYKILDTTVDSRFLDTKNRPALAQTFEENATGARFTLVINHLKSKGSDCNDVGDPDMGDGQSNCNKTREAAAQALVDWLATDPTGSGDADYLIMGDLNSYAMEDPIKAILAGPDDTIGTYDDYTNLIEKYQGKFAYSYVFDGQAGYLDQALASPSLAAQIMGAADWHINADEADVLDYDTSFKSPYEAGLYEAKPYRTSDHDPVVVGLNLTRYNWDGFHSPIANLPSFNKANAGSAVPLKFSLGGDQGLAIFQAGYPLSMTVSCKDGTQQGPAEQTLTTEDGALAYDPILDEYSYSWKTDKSWSGTCRRLVVVNVDGSIHSALFKLK